MNVDINRPTGATTTRQSAFAVGRGVILGAMAVALPAFASISVAADGGGGPCYYEVTVLDLIPDCGFGTEPSSTTPLAIADNGWITGRHPQCNGTGNSWVMLNTGGTAVEELIPPFAGVYNSEGRGISNTGVIVGSMDIDGEGQRGFIRNAEGAWEKIEPVAGGHAGVLSISESGEYVVGYRDTDNDRRGFVWREGQFTHIEPTFGVRSVANGANDLGDVVGWMGTSNGTDSQPFLFTNGQTIDLGLVPFAAHGNAKQINKHGQILVRFRMSDDDPLNRTSAAFKLDDGVWTDIGILPGYDSIAATGMNDHGVIIGWCRTINTPIQADRAYIWRNGEMTALEDLIDPALDYQIRQAHAINERGEITAVAVTDGLPISFAIVLSPPNPADINGDCITNHLDLLILLNEWGFAPSSPADLNHDEVVNVVDLLFLLGNWGS